MRIIAPIPRNERRQMKKFIHKTRDKDYARRLMALLMCSGQELSDTFLASSHCLSYSAGEIPPLKQWGRISL